MFWPDPAAKRGLHRAGRRFPLPWVLVMAAGRVGETGVERSPWIGVVTGLSRHCSRWRVRLLDADHLQVAVPARDRAATCQLLDPGGAATACCPRGCRR